LLSRPRLKCWRSRTRRRDDEFALFGFPEFVRLGDGFCWDAPVGLEGAELTDIGVVGVAAALRRAASWSIVTLISAPHTWCERAVFRYRLKVESLARAAQATFLPSCP
jgi:hypothetical protein